MVVPVKRIGHECIDRRPHLGASRRELGIDRGLVGAKLRARDRRWRLLLIECGVMADAQRHSATYHEIGNAVSVGRIRLAADGVGQLHADGIDPAMLDQLVLQRLPDRSDKLRPSDRLRQRHLEGENIFLRHRARLRVIPREAQGIGIVAVREDDDACSRVVRAQRRGGNGGEHQQGQRRSWR